MSVCVCVHACVRACLCVRVCVRAPVRACMLVCADMHACVHVCARVLVFVGSGIKQAIIAQGVEQLRACLLDHFWCCLTTNAGRPRTCKELHKYNSSLFLAIITVFYDRNAGTESRALHSRQAGCILVGKQDRA